jgi:hypothetical protein
MKSGLRVEDTLTALVKGFWSLLRRQRRLTQWVIVTNPGLAKKFMSGNHLS